MEDEEEMMIETFDCVRGGVQGPRLCVRDLQKKAGSLHPATYETKTLPFSRKSFANP